MFNNIRLRVINFIEGNDSTIGLSIIAALAAGLYPLLHYYNSNFSQVNSWSQFAFFLICFLLIPLAIFVVTFLVFRNFSFLKKYCKYILSILNFVTFFTLIIIVTYGSQKKLLIIAFIIALILGILLYRQIRKVLVFQFLLSLMGFVKLTPEFYRHVTYSDKWMEQPDNIEKVKFVKKPNVYVIQPDGYANFSELKQEPYNFDNSEVENYLIHNSFKIYKGFRSNYRSTLSSNSSMFAMKHHYYNKPKRGINELYKSREVIAGDNPVISILKNNGYKTFLILEKPYLLVNRPQIFYDYCNFNYHEMPYLDRGLDGSDNVEAELKNAILENKATSNFYFIEKILPGHISNSITNSKGKKEERLNYLENLKASNKWLRNIVSMILDNDANGLIVIVADHGGFVGMNSTADTFVKQHDSLLVRSVFTATLAIKWSDDVLGFDDNLNTNVNLFRVLFSYLSENKDYLNYLQQDKSYLIIDSKAPFGVYELIDGNGDVVFNKVE